MRLLPLRLATLTAIAGLSIPLCAASQTSSEGAHEATAATSAQNIAITDRYLTAVQAEIVGKVDTRNAAAGQSVMAQTSQPATLADGTELPRGTKLVGRILRVQAYEKEQSGAILAMTFDHAELKGGRSVPVRCVIRMVAPAGNIAANTDPLMMPGGSSRGGAAPMGGGGLSPVGGGDPIDSSPMGGSVPMAGPGGNPGGMGTGSRGGTGTNSTAGSTGTRGGLGTGIGGIGSGDPGLGGTTRSIGDTAGTALGTTTSVAAATADRPVVSAGESIHDVPHRTGLPGVLLSNSTAAGVSGTLSAFDRNISLDSNTQITLGVITR